MIGRPFEETDAFKVMDLHVEQDIPDPADVVPGLPGLLRDFILKACARDPEARFRTAVQVLEALEPLADQIGMSSAPSAFKKRKLSALFLMYREDQQIPLNRLMEDFSDEGQADRSDSAGGRFQGHLKREKGNASMLNLQQIKIEYTMDQLSKVYERNYSNLEQQLGNIIVWSTHLALENIANSDSLYHDVDHTIMVALAGQAIIEGKHLREGGVTPRDWMHYMIAVLCHDIGYVKGVCRNDTKEMFATGVGVSS